MCPGGGCSPKATCSAFARPWPTGRSHLPEGEPSTADASLPHSSSAAPMLSSPRVVGFQSLQNDGKILRRKPNGEVEVERGRRLASVTRVAATEFPLRRCFIINANRKIPPREPT